MRNDLNTQCIYNEGGVSLFSKKEPILSVSSPMWGQKCQPFRSELLDILITWEVCKLPSQHFPSSFYFLGVCDYSLGDFASWSHWGLPMGFFRLRRTRVRNNTQTLLHISINEKVSFWFNIFLNNQHFTQYSHNILETTSLSLKTITDTLNIVSNASPIHLPWKRRRLLSFSFSEDLVIPLPSGQSHYLNEDF